MSSDVAATLDPASARVRRGRAIGAMIFAIFGGAWLALWNYRAEPHRWVVYGLIAAAALALFLFARSRYRRYDAAAVGQTVTPERRKRERWFHLINAGQWVLILIVGNVLVNVGHSEWVLPMVVLIVGLHFLPLAALFSYRGHYVTGIALVLVALIVPRLAPGGPADPTVCLCAGLILWASALWGLIGQRAPHAGAPVSRMRAVRLHGIGDLRFEHIPAPEALAADQVRVRVRAAGICGSDLHNFRTGQWLRRVPIVPGHEFAGEVLAVGAGVGHLKPGDRVIGDSRMSCGTCPRCLEGLTNVCDRMGYVGQVCDGAFAERIDLPERQLLRLSQGLPMRVAALTEPLGVALRVVRRLDPPRDTPILIAGAGPIGGLAAMLLQHLGFGPLALIERNVQRAALIAGISGASIVAAEAPAIAAFAGEAGLRCAIEATGSHAVLKCLLDALAGGGRLAMVGIFTGESTVPTNAIVERELELRGCSGFCEEQHEALALLPALCPKLERVISPAITLEQMSQAYQSLLAGESPYLKTIVEP